jgi:hypothetical protein
MSLGIDEIQAQVVADAHCRLNDVSRSVISSPSKGIFLTQDSSLTDSVLWVKSRVDHSAFGNLVKSAVRALPLMECREAVYYLGLQTNDCKIRNRWQTTILR